MPLDRFTTDLEALERAQHQEHGPKEIPWSEACARARWINVRLRWGDGYDIFAGLDDAELAVVVDRTSAKLNRLSLEMAITLTDLLARRAGMSLDRIRFPHPKAMVDRETLLDWLAAIPAGSRAAAEIAEKAEELRLPWRPDTRKDGR